MKDEKIMKILKDVFNETLGVNKFNLSITMDEVSEWDSLKHIRLLSSIEDSFEIEIQFEDAIEMITGKSILTKVKKYITDIN
tara:strand:- start:14 stop:259 length:246 start_codon:yes stop_codon:yes gene_type:complete